MSTITNLRFVASSTDSLVPGAKTRVVLAEKSLLDASANLVVEAAGSTAEALEPILDGSFDSLTLHGAGKKGERSQTIVATFSAERSSRHLGVVRGDLITDVLSKSVPKNGDASITLLLESGSQGLAAANAVARAFPLFSRKTNGGQPLPGRNVAVSFVTRDGKPVDAAKAETVANSTRMAARLVDTPAGELHSDAYLAEIEVFATELAPKGVSLKVIKGQGLEVQGFGGLWNVGKAAEHPPMLCVLSYAPAGSKVHTAFVGKGIIFDTGGLDIKSKDSMAGMKDDMGGSAACLGAFVALVRAGYQHALSAVLAIAENSVDSRSFRPDDIIVLKSGLSVEINNTDAEGRLVLGDAVAYATGEMTPKPDYIVDLATLTGAQSYATGLKHGGLLTKDEDFEKLIITSGKKSGDLVYPLIYCPELLGVEKQFTSEVADMKNSVKDRANAASSGAGHFIERHLNPSWKGKWAHLDIAAPASLTGHSGDRASGFGVALLVELAETLASA